MLRNPRNPWCPGVLENAASPGRVTEAQPGKAGQTKAHYFCLAEWVSWPSRALCGPGGWAGLSDPSAEAGCSLGARVGRAGLRAARTSGPSRHLTSLQFLNCRRGTIFME